MDFAGEIRDQQQMDQEYGVQRFAGQDNQTRNAQINSEIVNEIGQQELDQDSESDSLSRDLIY